MLTNEVGNIKEGKLPVSPGAKIKGSIEVKYKLIDHTKSVYNDKGDILVTTSIKIEAPSLEKTPQVKIDEFKSISLKDVTGGNVSKADQAKVRVFEYDSDKNDLTGENGNWFLKIEDAVSEMDNTPMNGWGDYSLYYNGPDVNHKLNIISPELVSIMLEDKKDCNIKNDEEYFVVSSFPNRIAGERERGISYEYISTELFLC